MQHPFQLQHPPSRLLAALLAAAAPAGGGGASLMRVSWLSEGGGPSCSDTPSSPVTSSSFSIARACITDSTAQHSTHHTVLAKHDFRCTP